MRGIFISVEGTDGSGKSTQLELIKDYFKSDNLVFVREPGGTKLCEKIRDIIINNDMCPESEALLYAASRAELANKVIMPALKSGKTVICDRYIDSSIAYQGYGRKMGIEKIIEINSFVFNNCMPDMTLFFDITPEECILRKKEQKELDRIESESLDFHKRVYKGYLDICYKYPSRVRSINAVGTVNEVFERVKSQIDLLRCKNA